MTGEYSRGITTRIAARVAGLTPAMVDYLCRTGIVVPSGDGDRGRGRPRAYTFTDLVVLRSVAHLLGAGVSVARLRDGLKDLQKSSPEVARQTAPTRFLVTDGTKVYYCSRRELLQELGTGQYAFRFVLEVSKVERQVVTRMTRAGAAKRR